MTRAFLNAMSTTVTGVTVVTTRTVGVPVGRTVRAMCSVSDAPPRLLIVADQELATAIVTRGAFAVNVLADHQAELAEAFSGSPAFETRHWWPLAGGGLPLLHGAAAHFACRLVRVHEDAVIIGEVVRASRGSARPLAYTRRGYAAPLAA